MMNEIKIIISILVISLLSVFEIAVNAKKNRRIRQFPLVLCASVLMTLGACLWTFYLEAVAGFCSGAELLKNANLLVVNAGLLLGYTVIRLLLVPMTIFICKKQTLLERFSFGLYQYDGEYDEWFLKKQGVNFRKYFLAMLFGVNIAAGVFLGLSWVGGPRSGAWMVIYPCAAIAVINEIYNYINGQTKEEFAHSIMGDDADARRVSNYYRLKEVLEQILPEPLLSAHMGCEFMGTVTPADLVKQLKASKDETDKITAEYFDIDGRYKTADVDCFQATLQMMHRRNVVFFNPFYRDLGMYITLPFITALLSGKKCVVLCGRKAAAEDVRNWISDILCKYSHMRSMWRVSALSDKEPESEVGILTFTQIYDKRVINTNREFLKETDFVLLIEPSAMLSTSQVALSIIAEEIKSDGNEPIYCICDRNAGGLIDTLSHLLHSEITDVVAPPVPRCNYTAMLWDADGDFCRQKLFDKQTKYLGNGIELAAIAIKNQIPKVSWYSETKTPIKDIKWIAGQYFSTICRYTNQASQQSSLYEKIDFVSNLWGSGVSKEEFLIAEDEFCNMFSMVQAYLSRGKNQVFVNILSENYLLRDYMRCNRQMFMSAPNAIPSLVPDYAKTERNTILKLILMMTLRPVADYEILREFHLIGMETDDAFGAISELLHKYTYADNTIFTVQTVRTSADAIASISSCTYSISDEKFEKFFSDSLKNAYYILEDEKNEEGYIDAKLFSHVTQTILPGQFVTYDGKYYVVKHVSPQSGVVLRRASELFDGRKYYRQIRTYKLDQDAAAELVSVKKIGDVEFSEIRVNFRVDTTGYLEMSDRHNLRTARIIDFSEDPSVSNYVRKYRNKSILCIKLPESDDKIRFTICLLLSEIFKSVFTDSWQYITAVTERPEDIDGMLNYMVYQMEGGAPDGCIYIIEDSDIDLGLLDAVEKNFMKLMEIITDFLEWHFEKMREPAIKDPVPTKVSVTEFEEKKKRTLVVRMLDRIRKVFGGNPEADVTLGKAEQIESKIEDATKQPSPTEAPEEAFGGNNTSYEFKQEETEETEGKESVIAPVAENEPSVNPLKSADEETQEAVPDMRENKRNDEAALPEMEHPEDEFEPDKSADPDLVHIDGTDIFDNEGMPEDNDYLERSFEAIDLIPLVKSKYQRECFLKLGYEEIDSRIRIDELKKYLRVRGWGNNALTLARKRETFIKNQLDTDAINQCDFCGLPLSGISYERLNDGRVRCNDCASSAISNVEDFKELFYRTLEMMEDFFGIRYRVPIGVKMADARVVAKGTGGVFRPSTQIATRVLGFAQRKNGKYSLLIENGSPRLATIDTMVHEMTHIWQYLNWDDKKIAGIYGMSKSPCTAKARNIVYEGMAMWASIQYLYQIGETYYAARQEALAEARTDIYGTGFRLYAERYPIVRDSSMLKYSPFLSFPTVEPDDVKTLVRAECTEKECTC